MRYFFLLFFTLLFISCSQSTPIQKETSIKNHLDASYLSKLDFKGEEIISVFINNSYYYVRKDGKAMQTLTYDNQADPFSDGLARTKVKGKIGFFNSNLDMVLKPIYDFAFPFYKGKAEICLGCKEKEEGVDSILDGGRWKKIDRTGLIIE